MNKFVEILKSINELSPLADRDLSDIPSGGYAGFAAAKRNAQDTVEKLKQEYRDLLLVNAAVVFLVTEKNDPEYFDKVTKFVDISTKEGVNVIIDGSDLYNRMASKLDHAVSMDPRRQYMVDHAVGFAESLREEARKVDIRTGSVGYSERLVLNNFEETLDFVKNTVRNLYGDIINALFIRKSLVDQALEAKHSTKMLPVVVYGLTTNEVENMKPSFNVNLTINLDDVKVDKKFALTQFSDLKTLFNNQ